MYHMAHPDWARYLLVIDLPEDDVELAEEKFAVVRRTLQLRTLGRFCFAHNAFHTCAAVRSWFLEWALGKEAVSQLIYLDCDSRIYAPMTEVIAPPCKTEHG
jgi:hypothetical protein